MDSTSSSNSVAGGALRVLFVASECAPYAKCGGLGDVVASLPKALRQLGADARVVLPLYAGIDREQFGLHPAGPLAVMVGTGERFSCEVWEATAPGGVPVAFIAHESFFGRAGIYNDPGGEGYSDNAERFGLLCFAAMALCEARGFAPDIAHVHDWPTAILPALLTARRPAAFAHTRTVLTIHNEAYQGYSPASALPFLGLPSSFFVPDVLEAYGQLDLLKGGIVLADAVTTVSPTYAREILAEPAACGLAAQLAARARDPARFRGILNGADYDIWNPAADPALPAAFDLPDPDPGKLACKLDLQRALGLAPAASTPLYGIVCRLTPQKGMALLIDLLDPLLAEMRLQLALLGNGDPDLENAFRDAAHRHPHAIAAHIGYSDALAHRIQAGSDFFLMPSLFEPCGLAQLYALRYGTLPIVHATGGLADTIEQYDETTGDGTGFKFDNPAPCALHDAIGWANSTYFDRPAHFAAMRRRAMARRFDWTTAARHYLDLYRTLLVPPATTPRSLAP